MKVPQAPEVAETAIFEEPGCDISRVLEITHTDCVAPPPLKTIEDRRLEIRDRLTKIFRGVEARKSAPESVPGTTLGEEKMDFRDSTEMESAPLKQ